MQLKTPKQIAVIGAGLVGSLAALMLSRRGASVRLYEQRPDPKKTTWLGGRSINLAISTRGLSALKRVALEQSALKESIRMPGRQVHSMDGSENFQPYGSQSYHCIHSISRGRLNLILLEELLAEKKVPVLYGHTLSHWSKETGWVFTDSNGGNTTLGKDTYVLACDGGGSAVRRQLAALNHIQSVEQPLEYGYKELTLPADASGKWQMKKEALHIWPRGNFMLIALPNLDGTYTATLFLPLKGAESFDSLSSQNTVRNFFTKYFADAVAWMPEIVEEFMARPLGHMGTVKATPWHCKETKTLLLGDAAHAIVPFFGQGMNCGFEDCSVLDEWVAKNGLENWEGLTEAVFSARKDNADAIAAMALENFVEMRDLVADIEFLKQKEIEKHLHEIFPAYMSRYEMVSFTRIPYKVVLEAGKKQKEILKQLSADFQIEKAKRLIQENLQNYFQYWEQKDGTWY